MDITLFLTETLCAHSVLLFGWVGFLRAAPQQSEICVKFSVFHTVFDVKFW